MMIPSLRAWICAVLLLCMLPAAAQQHRSAAAVAALEANIDRAGGNTHAYEFAPLHDTKPPKGFKPFYISHYGRHGSRSDWSGPYYRELIRILEEAGRIGILTLEGDSLLAETRLVNDAHAGMDGRLSQRGVREHAQLAERMYRRYPEVFRKGSTHVRSISSIGQRCLISMAAFTTRLDECAGGRLDFYWDNGETFQYVVSNDASKETRQKSQRLIDSLDRSFIQDSVQIKERLFTNPVEARKLIPDIFVFERMIFQTAKIAKGCDIDRNIFRHLPFDVIYKWWELDNFDLYIRHCNSVEFGLERMPLTEPLVRDIVEKADEAISQGNWAADLRFGHDNPLVATASYLGLEGVGDRWNASEVSEHWWAFEMVPFAANLQLVFYRNKAGDVLVKFLYNEQETLVRGLTPVEGPYYRWSDVRENIKGYLR